MTLTKTKSRQCDCCGIVELREENEHLHKLDGHLLCENCIEQLDNYVSYWNYNFSIQELSSIDIFENITKELRNGNNC